MVNRYTRRTNFKTRKRNSRKNTRRRKSRRKTKRGGVYPGKQPAARKKPIGNKSHIIKPLGILQQPSKRYPKGMLYAHNQKKKMKELSNMFRNTHLAPPTRTVPKKTSAGKTSAGKTPAGKTSAGKTPAGKKRGKDPKYSDDQLEALIEATRNLEVKSAEGE